MIIAGACAGLIGGSFASVIGNTMLSTRLDRLAASLAASRTTSTRVVTASYLSLQNETAVTDAGLLRRRSPVAVLMRSLPPLKGAEDRIVGEERAFATAVILTSDGWLGTAASAFSAVRAADTSVAWDGRMFPVRRAIRDTATDAIYLKIDASDLPVAAFVRPDEIFSGSRAWIEPRPKRLIPEFVTESGLRLPDAVSSERASRRFWLTSRGEEWMGSPVWDQKGRLIGVVDGKGAGSMRVLPASDFAGALEELFADSGIHHAVLGVRTSDLASLVFDQGRRLPLLGGWIRAGKRGEPAVEPSGPSAMALKEGDVIEALENDILDGTADLGERLLEYRPGSQITLHVLRGGERIEVKVTLGSARTSEIIK